MASGAMSAEQLDRDTKQRPTHPPFYIKDHSYGHKRNTSNRERETKASKSAPRRRQHQKARQKHQEQWQEISQTEPTNRQ